MLAFAMMAVIRHRANPVLPKKRNAEPRQVQRRHDPVLDGEINCIDSGGFGAVTITKSITIDCANVEAGVLVAGTNGIIVSAGATDVVILRGLDLIGTIATPAVNGILFNTGGALHVEKCLIWGFKQAAPSGFGILFQPTGASELFVIDTVITTNGSGSGGGAINIRPTGAGSARVTIVRTNALNNLSGITADTATGPTSGTVFTSIRESVSSGNTLSGISAVASAAGAVFTVVDHSSTTFNGTGINASGAAATVLVGSSTIVGNDVGLALAGGAKILSFGTNQVNNTGGAAFTPPVFPLQ
jgi:hypothetical protein